jgi:hypothetical protein
VNGNIPEADDVTPFDFGVTLTKVFWQPRGSFAYDRELV